METECGNLPTMRAARGQMECGLKRSVPYDDLSAVAGAGLLSVLDSDFVSLLVSVLVSDLVSDFASDLLSLLLSEVPLDELPDTGFDPCA